ncbi:MAG: DUF5615 family PIN-like protein [Polyangiaceae bacterium]|nr:DUF5615 family PIN-like protein [Polyangiaceae bacterium]
MKLKLDENLPTSAKGRLQHLGFEVDTVLDEGLGGRSDDEVFAAAQREQRLLVTQDLDFSDMRKFAPGTHAGIFIARVPEPDQWQLADFLAAAFGLPEASSWAGCLVVATLTKIRVLRAPTPDAMP